MKKENVKIKSNITIVDEISTIQNIVEYYFTDGEYTPYYADMAKVTAVAQNFLDGVEFEAEDYVYECVMTNDDLYKCVKDFIDAPLMGSIMKQVEDIVEFKKQKLIHNSDAFAIVGDMCLAVKDMLDNYAKNNEIAQKFVSDLQESGINEETLTNAVRNAADQFKMSENEVIEGQRQRIAEQQTQLQEKEAEIQDLRKWKREHMARNVKAVKGEGKIKSEAKTKTTTKSSK